MLIFYHFSIKNEIRLENCKVSGSFSSQYRNAIIKIKIGLIKNEGCCLANQHNCNSNSRNNQCSNRFECV